MTQSTEVAIIVFLILLLLPWGGGLFLTIVNFLYAREIVQDQSKRLRELGTENERLHAENNTLRQENQDLNLKLQVTLVENASLSVWHDRGQDEGQDITG